MGISNPTQPNSITQSGLNPNPHILIMPHHKQSPLFVRTICCSVCGLWNCTHVAHVAPKASIGCLSKTKSATSRPCPAQKHWHCSVCCLALKVRSQTFRLAFKIPTNHDHRFGFTKSPSCSSLWGGLHFGRFPFGLGSILHVEIFVLFVRPLRFCWCRNGSFA